MKTLSVALLLTAGILVPSALQAGKSCCNKCGCESNVRKVCKLVCEEKEVEETEYDCKCEDFCIPGKSTLCGEKCECDCDAPHGVKCKKIWQPAQCGEVRTRHVLVKNVVKKKVPSYKWVVEYVCDSCCADGGHHHHGHHAQAEQNSDVESSEQVVSEEPTPSPTKKFNVLQAMFGAK